MQISFKKMIALYFCVTLNFFCWSIYIYNKKITKSYEQIANKISHLVHDMRYISQLDHLNQAIEFSSSASAKSIFEDFLESHAKPFKGLSSLFVFDSHENHVIAFKIAEKNRDISVSEMISVGSYERGQKFILNDILFIPVILPDKRYALYATYKISRILKETPTISDVSIDINGHIDLSYNYLETLKSSFVVILFDFIWSVFCLFFIFRCRKMSISLNKKDKEIKFHKEKMKYLENNINHCFDAIQNRIYSDKINKYELEPCRNYAKSILDSFASSVNLKAEKNDLQKVIKESIDSFIDIFEDGMVVTYKNRHKIDPVFDKKMIAVCIQQIFKCLSSVGCLQVEILTKSGEDPNFVKICLVGEVRMNQVFPDELDPQSLIDPTCSRIVQLHSSEIFATKNLNKMEFYFWLSNKTK